MMIPDIAAIPRLSQLESRCISPENPSGAKGMGARAGGGWKGSPFVRPFDKDALVTVADVEGRGMIRHIWLAIGTERNEREDVEVCRNLILRCYWDGQECLASSTFSV